MTREDKGKLIGALGGMVICAGSSYLLWGLSAPGDFVIALSGVLGAFGGRAMGRRIAVGTRDGVSITAKRRWATFGLWTLAAGSVPVAALHYLEAIFCKTSEGGKGYALLLLPFILGMILCWRWVYRYNPDAVVKRRFLTWPLAPILVIDILFAIVGIFLQ